MSRPSFQRILAPLVLTAVSASAFSQLAALASVPSFKTLKPELLIFEYRQTSLDSPFDSRYTKNFEILYGLNSNVELAFDNNLDENLALEQSTLS